MSFAVVLAVETILNPLSFVLKFKLIRSFYSIFFCQYITWFIHNDFEDVLMCMEVGKFFNMLRRF